MKKNLCALLIATTLSIGGLSTNAFAATTKVPNELKTTSSELKTLTSEIKGKREEIKASFQTKIEAIKNLEAKGVKKAVIKDSIKDLKSERQQVNADNKTLKTEISDLNINIKDAKQNADKSKINELKKSQIDNKNALKANLDKIISILGNITAKLNTL